MFHSQVKELLSLDRDRFKQIIVNLFGNCVRYTEQGGKYRFILNKMSMNGYCMWMIAHLG